MPLPFLTTSTTRRRLIVASGFAAITFSRPGIESLVLAQDEASPAVGTPSTNIGAIRPTGVGDVPTTGASRPGPADAVHALIIAEPVAPVGLNVESAGIDAGIERLRVVDGAMQDPSGPWEVAW